MDEQDRQYMTGECNPESIRLVYLQISLRCQVAARRLGREGERFVQSITNGEEMKNSEDWNKE